MKAIFEALNNSIGIIKTNSLKGYTGPYTAQTAQEETNSILEAVSAAKEYKEKNEYKSSIFPGVEMLIVAALGARSVADRTAALDFLEQAAGIIRNYYVKNRRKIK